MEQLITLYGAQRCHKTQHYQQFFQTRNLAFTFLDVEQDPIAAEQLRSLYDSRKLNFPTITIGEKRLRNPNDQELEKWLIKLGI